MLWCRSTILFQGFLARGAVLYYWAIFSEFESALVDKQSHGLGNITKIGKRSDEFGLRSPDIVSNILAETLYPCRSTRVIFMGKYALKTTQKSMG